MSVVQNKINGLLGLANKAGKILCGSDAVEEAIYKKKIKLVLIAEDSSDKTRFKFLNICLKNNVKSILYGTIQENSKAIGKLNKAIIAIKDKNFADAILKKIYGGDTIG